MKTPIRWFNKKGSGLVEAAMVMPFFLLAVLMLLSPISVVSSWENVLFSACDEMRYESAKAAFSEQREMMKLRLTGRVASENPDVSGFRIKSVRYGCRKQGIDDLIMVTYTFSHQGNDLYQLFGKSSFEMKAAGRAFTGKLHKTAPVPAEDEEDADVYVFPEWGMRYHKKSCTYIKSSCQMVYLTTVIQKKYDPCSLCHAKSAQIGSPVFCFTKYGKVYHLDHCKTISRYYVVMKEGKARNEGYTPCLKCGG